MEIAETVRLARLAVDTGGDDPDVLCMAAIPLINFARDIPQAKAELGLSECIAAQSCVPRLCGGVATAA